MEAHPAVREDLRWLYDYWLYYPYDPAKDHPDIEFTAIDQTEFRKYHSAESKKEFLTQMFTIFTTPGYSRDVIDLYRLLLFYHASP